MTFFLPDSKSRHLIYAKRICRTPTGWEDTLMGILQKIQPDLFDKICRLLFSSGLLSFHGCTFQCAEAVAGEEEQPVWTFCNGSNHQQ